jgi:hypothetical protein
MTFAICGLKLSSSNSGYTFSHGEQAYQWLRGSGHTEVAANYRSVVRQRNKAVHDLSNLELGHEVPTRRATARTLQRSDSEASTAAQSDTVAHPDQDCVASTSEALDECEQAAARDEPDELCVWYAEGLRGGTVGLETTSCNVPTFDLTSDQDDSLAGNETAGDAIVNCNVDQVNQKELKTRCSTQNAAGDQAQARCSTPNAAEGQAQAKDFDSALAKRRPPAQDVQPQQSTHGALHPGSPGIKALGTFGDVVGQYRPKCNLAMYAGMTAAAALAATAMWCSTMAPVPLGKKTGTDQRCNSHRHWQANRLGRHDGG